jgi:catechol 2,3-dioxygenase-like lactoylglutathione lyase family enzyme
MRISALDHIVLNVEDVERSLEFYSGLLGLAAERVEEWRRGRLPFPSVRVNEATLIDLVKGTSSAGSATQSNLAHFCLVTEDADVTEISSQLTRAGLTIEEGPAIRSGARGDALSIYFRDPDRNLIEVRTYARKALIRFAIEDSRTRVHAAIDALQDPDAPLANNEAWSRKDLVAHLTSIEGWFRTVLVVMGNGGPWGTTEPVEQFNTRAVAERRTWTLRQLAKEVDEGAASLQALLESVSESDLSRIVEPPNRPPRKLGDWWLLLQSHARRHLAELDQSA